MTRIALVALVALSPARKSTIGQAAEADAKEAAVVVVDCAKTDVTPAELSQIGLQLATSPETQWVADLEADSTSLGQTVVACVLAQVQSGQVQSLVAPTSQSSPVARASAYLTSHRLQVKPATPAAK